MLLTTTAMLAALAVHGGGPIEWVTGSLSNAVAKAQAENKMILVYCWADGSEFCGKLYQETLSNERAGEALQEFVCFNAKHSLEGMPDLFEKFGVRTLPTLLFLTSDGKAEDLITGFITADDLTDEVARIQRGEETISGLRKLIQEAKKNSAEDLSMRWRLAGKIQGLGDENTHDVLMDSIRRDDPKGKTLTGSRVRLADVVKEIVGDGDGDGDGDGGDGDSAEAQEKRKNLDISPLYAHAKLVKLPESKFEAWDRIGNMEAYRMDMAAAIKAFERAAKLVPEERGADWGSGIARWIVEYADQRTSKEKKFALELAQSSVKLARKYVAKANKEGENSDDNDIYLANNLNTLAWAYSITGKHTEAVAAAEECVALFPDGIFKRDLKSFQKKAK